MKKRWASIRAKNGQVKVAYGKADGEGPDLCVAWGDGCPKSDARYILGIFTDERYRHGFLDGGIGMVEMPSAFKELEDRGYDISTLKFTIEKKK